MSRPVRPDAVRRWLRLPLLWGAVALALAGALFLGDVRAARSSTMTYGHGYAVVGEVTRGVDGGDDLAVAYRHPASGVLVHTTTHVWNSSRRPSRPGVVALEVSRADPRDVVVAGDRFPVTANLANYAWWALFPFLVWAIRRRTVGRSEALMASADAAYLMTARVSAPSWWGKRPRLHLFPLDTGPGGQPVCTVALVDASNRAGAFTVEVKGAPRPYARVVARATDSGALVWPAGRALRSHGRRPPTDVPAARERAAGRAACILAIVGVALFIVGVAWTEAGTDSEDVRARAQIVNATVTGARALENGTVDVSVTYIWAGQRYDSNLVETFTPDEGTRLAVRIDSVVPTRVWSTTQETPPGTSEHDLGYLLLGLGVAIVGLALFALVRWWRAHAGSRPKVTWTPAVAWPAHGAGRPMAPPGWYPVAPGQLGWWDGYRWGPVVPAPPRT